MLKDKLFKNLSWLFFDKVIRIFGGLFVGIWVARYLGPKDFGVLNYAMAYTAFFMLFVKLGLDQIVVREIVKKPKLTNYILGTAFYLKLIGALVAISGIFLSLEFMEIDDTTKLVILMISAGFVFQSLDVIDFYFQSLVLSKYVVIARNSAFVLSSLLKVYFILENYNVVYFAFAGVVDFLLAGLFLLFMYKKNSLSIQKWKFSKKLAIEMLKYSWPLGLSILLISIHTKIDQIMIGQILNMGDVGIYSVAVRLYEVWLFIPSIIVSTLLPYFVNLRKSHEKLYYFRLGELYFIMFWMGVAVGIIAIVYGTQVINYLFGKVYEEAYTALVINIWIGIFISQSLARSIWMINENLQIYRVYINVISIITNVSLNMMLIPIYGISGAAYASLISIGLGVWIVPLLFKPMRASTISMLSSIIPIQLILKRM